MNNKNVKIAEAARELLKLYGYFVDNLWHVEDIHFICEQHGHPALTDEEAMQIFDIAAEQFDGERGVSWPELEKATQSYFYRKALLKKIYETVV